MLYKVRDAPARSRSLDADALVMHLRLGHTTSTANIIVVRSPKHLIPVCIVVRGWIAVGIYT